MDRFDDEIAEHELADRMRALGLFNMQDMRASVDTDEPVTEYQGRVVRAVMSDSAKAEDSLG